MGKGANVITNGRFASNALHVNQTAQAYYKTVSELLYNNGHWQRNMADRHGLRVRTVLHLEPEACVTATN